MTKEMAARASIDVNAPVERVWNALVNPELIQKYMFGTKVETDWKVGSNIVWKGEWKGKPYEDKGKLLKVQPSEMLQYSHYSPLSGAPETPENYHTVTIRLDSSGSHTAVTLTQDNNPTEEAQRHSEENWQAMLGGLKKVVEGQEQRR